MTGKPRIVDLTVEIYEGMPIFAAHQRPFMMVNQTHAQWRERYGTKPGFEAHNWLMSEHTGTHTDAVLEYLEDGASIEEMSLDEIARCTNRRIGTVKTHLFRALMNLRKWQEGKHK